MQLAKLRAALVVLANVPLAPVELVDRAAKAAVASIMTKNMGTTIMAEVASALAQMSILAASVSARLNRIRLPLAAVRNRWRTLRKNKKQNGKSRNQPHLTISSSLASKAKAISRRRPR